MLPVVCLRPVTCVPNVASCLSSSGDLCTQCCQFLWIVHSWLPLRFSLTFIEQQNTTLKIEQLEHHLWHLFCYSSYKSRERGKDGINIGGLSTYNITKFESRISWSCLKRDVNCYSYDFICKKNTKSCWMTRSKLIVIYIMCNMTGATSGAETAYSSGAPEFTSGFWRGSLLNH
jgi:hypothetical protein